MSRPFKTFLTAIALLVLLSFLAGAPVVGDAVFALVIGWARFAHKVFPKITVNPSGLGLFVLALAAAAVVGHRFCRWLRQGEEWRWRWTLAGLAGLGVLFAAGMAFTGVAHQTGWLLRSPVPLTALGGRASNERSASASLKTIASAQADFRANDRDGNRLQDFWRADIAGLYALSPEGGGEMIRLIELSVAGADAKPETSVDKVTVRSPKAGYWYRALRFKGESAPDPDRFAAIAFPDSKSAAQHMFIISHDNTIFMMAVGEGRLPEVYPDDPLKEGWVKLD